MNTPIHFLPFDANLQSYDAILGAYLQDLCDALDHPIWVSSSVTLLPVYNDGLGVDYRVEGSPLCHRIELRLLHDGVDIIFHCFAHVTWAQHQIALQHLLLQALQDYLPKVAPLQVAVTRQHKVITPPVQAATYQ